MHNKARGEVSIKLNGKIFILRPTFDAISKTEVFCDKTILSIYRDFSVGQISVTVLAPLLYFGILAASDSQPALIKDMTLDDVQEWVMQDGISDLTYQGIIPDVEPLSYIAEYAYNACVGTGEEVRYKRKLVPSPEPSDEDKQAQEETPELGKESQDSVS